MDHATKANFLTQLAQVGGQWANSTRLLRNSEQLKDAEAYRIIALARAAISRVSGKDSEYMKTVDAVMRASSTPHGQADSLVSVVNALRSDIHNGFIQSAEELIHGNLFADFLEMADHLLAEHYKDAAAVIGGSTLESHLRQLATKNTIDVETTNAAGDKKPKKADTLNAELSGKKVYGKLEQKDVTAWLDLRNKAAHGHYTEYDETQVRIFLDGVRYFMSKYTA